MSNVEDNKQGRIELIYSGRFVYRFIFYSEGFRLRLFFNMAAEQHRVSGKQGLGEFYKKQMYRFH